MYEAVLAEIQVRMEEDGDALQPPAGEAAVQALVARTRAELKAELPEPYAHFLRRHNGLDWNGLVVFATEPSPIVGYADRTIAGFIETNLARRDIAELRDYLIFASTGDEEYCLAVPSKKFVMLDAVSTDEIETYASFGVMLAAALQRRI
jgi:hypothetical protein